MLWGILDELEVKAHQTVMVGDSEYDMQLATNAGVDSLAVSYGAETKANLLRHKPIACVDKIEDLKRIF